MPVQTWSAGQILTAAELTTVTNLLLFPVAMSASVTGVAGNMYLGASASTIQLTLPAATAGRVIGVKNSNTVASGNQLQVVRAGSDTINGPGFVGVTTITLEGGGGSVILVSDGSTWHIVSSSGLPVHKTNQIATSETTTSTTYTALTTAGPIITAYTGNAVMLGLSARLQGGSAANGADMSFAVSGATTISAVTAEANGWFIRNPSQTAGTGGLVVGATFLVTGLTPGQNVFTAQYRSDPGSATETFALRTMWIAPAIS